MKPLYLSRVTLRDDVSLAQLRREKILNAEGYDAHKLVWSIMSRSPEDKRSFLYRTEADSGKLPSFWVLADYRPENYNSSLWNVASKPFAPILRKGDALRFLLRCSPTRSVKTDEQRNSSGKRKVKRVDVILEELRKTRPQDGSTRTVPVPLVVHNAASQWFVEKSKDCGFSVATELFDTSDDAEPMLSFKIENYRQVLHPKWEGKTSFASREDFRSNAVKLSLLDISGTIIVQDPDLLLQHICNGFGHAKAWGCGLMLIKRA